MTIEGADQLHEHAGISAPLFLQFIDNIIRLVSQTAPPNLCRRAVWLESYLVDNHEHKGFSVCFLSSANLNYHGYWWQEAESRSFSLVLQMTSACRSSRRKYSNFER